MYFFFATEINKYAFIYRVISSIYLPRKCCCLVNTFQSRTALLVVGFLWLQLALTFSQSFTVLCFSHTVNENTAHTMFEDLIEHISSLTAALDLAIQGVVLCHVTACIAI